MGFRCSLGAKTGSEGLKEKRQISSCGMKGPLSSLSSLVGHIRGMRSLLYGGKSGFSPNSASIYLCLARPCSLHTHTSTLTFVRHMHTRAHTVHILDLL